MNELEKSVIKFYTEKHINDVKKQEKTARDLAVMTDLYREKCRELERAEVIIEILFRRIENK